MIGTNYSALPRVGFLVLAFLLVVAAPSSASKVPQSTALIDDAMAALGFDADEEQALFQGKVLRRGLPKLERQPGELAVGSVMLFIRRSLQEVDRDYLGDLSFRANSDVLDFAGVPADASATELGEVLRGIAYSAEEHKETAHLLRFDGGSDFNLSREEIEDFHSLGDTSSVAVISGTYRRLLLDRLLVYRKRGLEAVAPYDRGRGATVAPASELLTALHSLEFVEKHFPEFHRALLTYPSPIPGEFGNRLYWFKRRASGRVLFGLAHRVNLFHEDYAVSAELQFYVGHSYNSMLTLMGGFPVEGGTLIFGAVRLFTDQVKGFGSSLKKRIGRRRVEAAVANYFEDLRALLERELAGTEGP